MTNIGVSGNGMQMPKSRLVTNGFTFVDMWGPKYQLVGTFDFYWDGSGSMYFSGGGSSLTNSWAVTTIEISTAYGTRQFTGSGMYRGRQTLLLSAGPAITVSQCTFAICTTPVT